MEHEFKVSHFGLRKRNIYHLPSFWTIGQTQFEDHTSTNMAPRTIRWGILGKETRRNILDVLI